MINAMDAVLPSMAMRGSGYHMPYRNVDGNDIDAVIAEFGRAGHRVFGAEGANDVAQRPHA